MLVWTCCVADVTGFLSSSIPPDPYQTQVLIVRRVGAADAVLGLRTEVKADAALRRAAKVDRLSWFKGSRDSGAWPADRQPPCLAFIRRPAHDPCTCALCTVPLTPPPCLPSLTPGQPMSLSLISLHSLLCLGPTLQDARVPIYAVKAGGTANLVRALRTLLGIDPSAGGP